jgi:hypothetical protein
MDAFFARTGPGTFHASAHAAGPWDPHAQHGGPPSALLASELAALGDAPGLAIARCTFELLGPVPVGHIALETRIARPGRRVQLLEGTLSAGGRAVLRARAWQIAIAQAPPTPAATAPPPLPGAESPLPEGWSASGYLRAIEWRMARGGFAEPGPAAAWTRPRIPLVAGEPLTPLARVLLVADSGNGISSALDLAAWHFINPELTVHLLRPAQGEWICLDAVTEIGADGPGLARSTLSDAGGPVAYGVQSLLVAPR